MTGTDATSPEQNPATENGNRPKRRPGNRKPRNSQERKRTPAPVSEENSATDQASADSQAVVSGSARHGRDKKNKEAKPQRKPLTWPGKYRRTGLKLATLRQAHLPRQSNATPTAEDTKPVESYRTDTPAPTEAKVNEVAKEDAPATQPAAESRAPSEPSTPS